MREAAKGVEFRFGEAFKGLLEEGVLAPGLDRFYEDTAYLLHETEKRHAVVCENFARTIPDLKLADTVNAQTHSLPPWGGEVSALAAHGTKVCRGSAGGHAARGRRACAGPCRRGLFRPGVS